MDYKSLYDTNFNGGHYSAARDYRHIFVEKNIANFNVNTAIDLGSGIGLGIHVLQKNPNIKITAFDLNNYHRISNVTHINGSLCSEDVSQLRNQIFDIVICLDVIEHLEESCALKTIKLMGEIAKVAIVSIAATIEPPVHVTIKPKNFWDEIIKQHFEILVEEEDPRPVFYYILKSKCHE